MQTKLIDGKALAERILHRTKTKVGQLKKHGLTPKLAVILVGENPASEIYVKKKGEAAMRLGMDFTLHRLSKTIKLKDLLLTLEAIQHDPTLSGLIVQLPLPKHLPITTIVNAVKPEYDVDCLSDINFGKLILNTYTIEPPTAGAIMEILNSLKLNLAGQHVCVVGTGALVGKPIAIMLMNKEATVTTCNSSTKKLAEKCRTADIIITGVGKANLIKNSMIKKGAIIIDAGVSFNKKGKAVGDVNVKDVLKKVRFVTPTPGGVGPVTVAMLLYNVVKLAEVRNKK
jgi:methylenetetrahydrofolate dehydrogenase (NADP+)/methenyltetrahydrofolate cyclohydrolase